MIVAQTLQRHLDHADCALDDHFPRINDSGRLLALEHYRGDLRCIGKICNARFDNLDSCLLDTLLNLSPDSVRDNLTGTAQASLIRYAVPGGVHIWRHIIGIDAHDIAECTVTLQGQKFFVIVHVEHRLCRVHNLPCDRNANLNRVAKAVVNLLLVVVERHDFQ